VNRWPAVEDALLAGFPAGKVGFPHEAGFELKTQAGVVLEFKFKRVVVGFGEEFDFFHNPAFGLGKIGATGSGQPER